MKLKVVFTVSITVLLLLSVVGVFSSTAKASLSYSNPSYYMDISNGNYRILDSNGNPTGYYSQSSGNTFNQLAGSGAVASSGQTICIKSGSYVVDYRWNEQVSNLYIYFESNAVLTLIATPNDHLGQAVFYLGGDYSVMDGAKINGNGLNQYPARNLHIIDPITGAGVVNLYSGIVVAGRDTVVQNCDVYNCRRDGIGGLYNQGNGFKVINNKVHEIGANAIDTASTDYNYPKRDACLIQGNEIWNVGDGAIFGGGYNTIVKENTIHDLNSVWTQSWSGMAGCVDSYWGIGLEFGSGTGNGNYFQIINNRINDCAGSGIIVANWGLSQDYILITGNDVSNCAFSPSGWWAGIDLWYSSNSIVAYNRISNCPIGVGASQPFEGSNYCYNNNIYQPDNTFSGCSRNFGNTGVDTFFTEPSQYVQPTPSPTSTQGGGGVGGGGSNPTPTPMPTSNPTQSNSTKAVWSQDPVFLGGFGVIGTVTSLPLIGLVAPVGRVLKYRRLFRRHSRVRRHRRRR